ncbi:MAG: hypothetical protein AMXMBFR67_16090 [Nitrospira sp.]
MEARFHRLLNQGGTTKFRKAFVPVSGRRLFYWQDPVFFPSEAVLENLFE